MNFTLSASEKKLEKLLFLMALLGIGTMFLLIMTHNQPNSIQNIATVSLFAIYIVMFTILGFNGIFGGNLALKWNPLGYILPVNKVWASLLNTKDPEKIKAYRRRATGFFILAVAIFCIYLEIDFLYQL